MSTVAASAAVLDHLLRDDVDNSVGGTWLPGQRTALRSVPAAGQSDDGGLDDPLRLGRAMRLRLRDAVQALLADPSIAGLKDAPKLAAVVLYAKSRAPKGEEDDLQTSIWGAELGRWMGMKESTVHHKVLPVLRGSDAVHTQVVRDGKGHPTGLDCLVMPLWRAHHGGGAGHPLALTKAELATLLHLCEALFGHGWTPKDKEPTPPGLLAGRTGKGAATDRLGLLLMVLNTRASGWLQLVGGSVKKREGRGAATLARLLGCSPSGARKVLARLTEAGVVARQRKATSTRMNGRGRVMLLPVARAYGHTLASVEAVSGSGAVFSQRPDGAVGDHGLAGTGSALGTSGIDGAEEAGGAAVQERPDGAELHTDHASVVTPVVPLQLSGGFSGEGRGADGRRPGRACVREDQAVDGESAVAGSRSTVTEGDPLRGEQPEKSPVDEEGPQAGLVAAPGACLSVAGGGRTPRRGRLELPADLDVRVALTPVSWLWQQLTGSQQALVVRAVRAELLRLASLLPSPALAPSVLADRLKDRLGETGGEARVGSAFGWLTRRGIVRRPSCSDVRCDDGIRLDTGTDCDTCANVLHHRRAWRARIEAVVDEEMPGLGELERRQAIEARLREHVALEAADYVRRREQAQAEEARRVSARARAAACEAAERERQEAAMADRQLLPCADCGRARSAGLCEACGYRRQTEPLIVEAGWVEATWSADLNNPADVAAVAATVRVEIEREVAAAHAQYLRELEQQPLQSGEEDATASVLAFGALYTVQQSVEQYRRRALAMLGRTKEAEAEARRAYAAEQGRHWHRHNPGGADAVAASSQAADAARSRVAEHLLAGRLEHLRRPGAPRAKTTSGRTWSERLHHLPVRPAGRDEAMEETA